MRVEAAFVPEHALLSATTISETGLWKSSCGGDWLCAYLSVAACEDSGVTKLSLSRSSL